MPGEIAPPAPGSELELDVLVRRGRRWLQIATLATLATTALTFALLLGMQALLLLQAYVETAWVDLVLAGLLPFIGLVAVATGVLHDRSRRWCPARLRVDAHAVYVDGRRVMLRRRITGGGLKRLDTGDVQAMLFGRRSDALGWIELGHFAVRVPKDDLAERILVASGVAPVQRALTARYARVSFWSRVALMLTPWPAGFAALNAPWIVGLHSWWWFVLAVAPAFALQMLVLVLTEVRVTVGIDGIHLGPLAARRFIPFAELAAVTWGRARWWGQPLKLTLASGKRIRLHAGGSSRFFEALRRPQDAVVARLEQALAAREGPTSVAGLVARVERGERSVHAWIRALRALPERSDYRQAAVSIEALRGVVADASLEGEVRAGAAVALRVAAGDEAAAWTREAARATASPQLRVALEAIAEEVDDDVLERRLATLAAPADEGVGSPARPLPHRW